MTRRIWVDLPILLSWTVVNEFISNLDAEEGNTHAASESSTSTIVKKIIMIKDFVIFTDKSNSSTLVYIICNGNRMCFQYNYLKIRKN